MNRQPCRQDAKTTLTLLATLASSAERQPAQSTNTHERVIERRRLFGVRVVHVFRVVCLFRRLRDRREPAEAYAEATRSRQRGREVDAHVLEVGRGNEVLAESGGHYILEHARKPVRDRRQLRAGRRDGG
jgi:hypothetical protein